MINYLDQHTGSATAILTAVLVLVTAFYAFQNWRMAVEMRKSRESAILPKLSLRFRRLGPAVVTTEIRNAGPGAALDVDVELRYVPLDGAAESEVRRLRYPVIAPGEAFDFMPPGDLNDNLNALPARYGSIELVGRMKDAAGGAVEVTEVFGDLAEWRDLIGKANQRWVDPNPEKRLADAMASKFGSDIREAKGHMASIAGSIGRHSGSADDESV